MTKPLAENDKARKGGYIIAQRHFRIAQKEGRLCEKCGWMISKKNWAKGYRQCPGCHYGYQGVRTERGARPYADEPSEVTGEML